MTKHIVIDARIRQSSTGRYADRLLEHLQELDNENRYTVLLDPKDSWKPKAKNFKAKLCKYRKFSFNPLDQLTFAWFLWRLRPNLVHFTMTPQEPVFYLGKHITTTHDLTMLRYTRAGRLLLPLHWVRMAGYKFLFWHSHRSSKVILVPTEWVKGDLSKLHRFARRKILVTLEASEPPLTVDPKPLAGVRKPFIMHLGSPFPHKNIENLVKAFEIMKDKHADLQLVLAGKKEFYFEKLEQSLVGNKFRNDIIFTGFVTDPQLKWLYENTEAYILPSLSEGFGLPGLEAMAHGAPVAASEASCLPEVYSDAAIYFHPKDPRHIAAVVSDLITSPALTNKLRTKGAERVICFSWKTMAKQTLEVYQQLLH